jgi:signal transduction histidine kinase
MKAKILSLLIFVFLFSNGIYGKHASTPLDNNEGTILIISSYSPDSKRVSSFMKVFEECIVKDGSKYDVYFEALSVEGMNTSIEWLQKVGYIFSSIKGYDDLKAVILLGQEAWSSFCALNLDPLPYPVFVCYASVSGIDLSTYSSDYNYKPKYLPLLKMADSKFMIGGQFFDYYPDENFKLIKEFYPDTKNIYLITDNSYGGVILKARFAEYFRDIEGINLFYIDGRIIDFDQAKSIVQNMSDNSVVLIGTWRIGKDGSFFLSSSIAKLIGYNLNIPYFTVTGNGLGENVIGGYVSSFSFDPAKIYKQISQYYSSGIEPNVEIFKGHYVLDEAMIGKAGIRNYQLPDSYEKVGVLESKIQTYKNVVAISSVALCLFILLLVFLFLIYYKNKRLSLSLKVRNEELSEAKEKAEQSEKMKSSFLANMSHEIRTPLNSIVGFSNLLCDGDVSPEEAKEYKDIILNNSSSLLKLINDILDISRLESGQMKFNMTQCDVINVCRNAMATLEPMRKENVQHIFKSPVDKYIIMSDELRLRQIILNFLNNASKFTEKGYIELSIDINENDNLISFIVTDTGPGIAPEKREVIFKRFEKINEFQQGFGLGLAISSQIAKSVNGRIYLDTEYENGARIVFERHIVLKDNELPNGGGGRNCIKT